MNQDDPTPRDGDQREEEAAANRQSTAGSLLEHLRTVPKWAGDDMERCLAELEATRGGYWFDEDGYLVPSPKRVLHIETDSGDSIDIDVTDIQDVESIGKPWYGPDSTGESLLDLVRRLPDWAGDDFEESLEDVIRSRTEARF
jgi:hypothetical protein